jgi:hypothetical protein
MVKRIILGLVLALMGVELIACSSERTVSPSPIHYNLYVARASGTDESIIDVIDTRTDSIVTSIADLGIVRLENFTVSPDGSFLAALDFDGHVAVVDLRTEHLVGIIQEETARIRFAASPLRLLCVMTDSILVYDLPGLEVNDVWHTAIGPLVDLHQRDEILGVRHVWNSETGSTEDQLIRLSSLTGDLIDSVRPRCGVPPVGMTINSLYTGPEADDTYIIAGDGHGLAVEAFDSGSAMCRFKTALESPWCSMTIAGGSEIWVTQDYSIFADPLPEHLGYILILDGATGFPVDTIRTLGVSLGSPSKPVAVFHIKAHPSDDKVYVGARMGRPALLVYDRETRRLVKSLYTDSPVIIRGLAMAPQ